MKYLNRQSWRRVTIANKFILLKFINRFNIFAIIFPERAQRFSITVQAHVCVQTILVLSLVPHGLWISLGNPLEVSQHHQSYPDNFWHYRIWAAPHPWALALNHQPGCSRVAGRDPWACMEVVVVVMIIILEIICFCRKRQTYNSILIYRD